MTYKSQKSSIWKKLGYFLIKWNFHSWINSLGMILMVAVTLGYIRPAAVQLVQVVKDTEDLLVDVGVAQETQTLTDASGNNFIVQLGSYFLRQCSIAQAELNSYINKFESKPQLFVTARRNFVVVGVPTTSREAAEIIQRQAVELSKNPKYQKEDLGNALIQANPNWSIISDCSQVRG